MFSIRLTPPPEMVQQVMAKNETINERIWNQSQSWHYERIFKFGCGGILHKLRTTIRHNACREQSWAKIERWDGNEWKQIHRIAGCAMKNMFSSVLASVRIEDFGLMTPEPGELMKVASAVLS